MVLLEKPNQVTSSASAARDGVWQHRECRNQGGDGSYFVGVSPAMQALRQYAELLAKIDAPVLITGEIGSGKETIARLIHVLSRRSANPFVAITCAAMQGHTLEEELFGSGSGILGNGAPRPGSPDNCQRGTVFLNDIVDMPMGNQAQLIHILKEHQFVRDGSGAPTDVDIRILASTGSVLKHAIAEHKLRSDLYYSLSAFVLHVPALRERPEDIPLLVEHFLRQAASHFDLPVRQLSAGIMRACEAHLWPGNLRQLQNVIRQYAVLGDEELLLKSLQQNPTYSRMLPGERDQEPGESRPGLKSLVRLVRDRTEKDLIVSALELTGWNRKVAAQKLNISYRSLLYKIEEHHLSPPKKASIAE